MTDQAAQPDPPVGGVVELPFEVEHWFRPRQPSGAPGPERLYARTLLATRDEAVDRIKYLRRVAMDPEQAPPPGMPRASRLRVVERRVVEEALPTLPPDRPLGQYKLDIRQWSQGQGYDPDKDPTATEPAEEEDGEPAPAR
jgi:hypothetical protein